ncbi:helix-turn-helix domain-containing protein [Streptomyces sp. NRRL B-24720]|uniref:helix-turn-helix domain-containing protein n=1 Tax=Streptomyces sp. NRRL B-24720 TaxID=1476876 RepID=UPI0004C9E470|nr:helix-turn-helix domain-containing protein [Streptomyces sp. NRRL B-24720]
MIQGAELQDLGLGEDEERTYEALLRQRAAKPAELARVLGIPRERLNAALTRLSDHGFTTPGDSASALPHPAAPAAAIRTLIHRRQAELHLRSAELERLMMSADRIAGRLMEGSPSASEGGIEVVTGTRAVGERAESLLASAEQEVMVFDRPPYARGPEDTDSSRSPGLDIKALLDRGIEVRTVMDREGLSYPGRMRSLNILISHGLRARVTTGVPTKLIIVDRRITLLPPTETTDPTATALVVGDALLRNALVPLFETVWDQATPLGGAGASLPETQKELLGLLASGLKDEAIARRMGVHVHTARRRISQLLDSLNAETRFQAGAQAILRGWLDV